VVYKGDGWYLTDYKDKKGTPSEPATKTKSTPKD